MNIFRGDVGRLQRCTKAVTGTEGMLPRSKPFKYQYEKEIVMYAYHKKLVYFSTECKYAPEAYRGYARAFVKDVEKICPRSIIDIIHSGEQMFIKGNVRMPVMKKCERCNYISSQSVCHACVQTEDLNRGKPLLSVGKASKRKQHYDNLSNKEQLT